MNTVNKKRKKPGRPFKTIKKEIRACVRLSQAEHFIIKEKAAKAGIKISEYLRNAAFNVRIISRLSEEEVQNVRHLIGMSNNVNQLAKIAHREGLYEATRYFEQYRKQFEEILLKLQP